MSHWNECLTHYCYLLHSFSSCLTDYVLVYIKSHLSENLKITSDLIDLHNLTHLLLIFSCSVLGYFDFEIFCQCDTGPPLDLEHAFLDVARFIVEQLV
jgi:hypothetical protein